MQKGPGPAGDIRGVDRGDGAPALAIRRTSQGQTARSGDAREFVLQRKTGDMSDFDLDERFGLVFVASNSLTHRQAAGDIVNCYRAARRHLAPGGRFAFDVFNPSVQVLAGGVGRGCSSAAT